MLWPEPTTVQSGESEREREQEIEGEREKKTFLAVPSKVVSD